MRRHRKSPQEKKRLSYAKDCRNTYGENDKASRKNLPRKRARVHRANRHQDSQALRTATGPADEAAADQAEQRLLGRRRVKFRKWPDTPLAEVAEYQQRRRVRLGINDAASAKATIDRIRSWKAGR